MLFRNLLIRLAANTLYVCRFSTLARSDCRYLVFTGTAGKTLARTVTAYALKKAGHIVVVPQYGYTNELGIVLAALGIEEPITLFSIRGMIRVCTATPRAGAYVGIELGADWRQDIPWFVRRFKPYGVIVTDLSKNEWAYPLADIYREKVRLIKSVQQGGFVAWSTSNPSADILNAISIDPEIRLVRFSVSRGENGDFAYKSSIGSTYFNSSLTARAHLEAFGCAIATLSAVNKNADLAPDFFLPYVPPPDRLTVRRLPGGAQLISDTYKSVPYCVEEVFRFALGEPTQRRVAVVTDMHPLVRNRNRHYEDLIEVLRPYDVVYLVGAETFVSRIQIALPDAIGTIGSAMVEILMKHDAPGTQIVIKSAGRYRLGEVLKSSIV